MFCIGVEDEVKVEKSMVAGHLVSEDLRGIECHLMALIVMGLRPFDHVEQIGEVLLNRNVVFMGLEGAIVPVDNPWFVF